ncbi:DUF1304 domain-containing protein [Patulibacter sp. SYSU D01012]|uniref:DUF1304 domain-containing protein n=1 Tax=Patulibacter sp. SYSU D01012 TaxID=2817381 RepID=UPI001B30947A|nr:DUF1304 domain-containing protein [Patulibacter sp. SYSU D01012]
MLALGLVFAGIGAAIHVYIFVLESFWWTTRARAVFGTTPDQAEATRELAYNQGFYNLFLAIAVAAGIVFAAAGNETVGGTLVLTGAGMMVAAGLVLLASSPDKARSALIQLGAPAVGVVLTAIALAG